MYAKVLTPIIFKKMMLSTDIPMPDRNRDLLSTLRFSHRIVGTRAAVEISIHINTKDISTADNSKLYVKKYILPALKNVLAKR